VLFDRRRGRPDPRPEVLVASSPDDIAQGRANPSVGAVNARPVRYPPGPRHRRSGPACRVADETGCDGDGPRGDDSKVNHQTSAAIARLGIQARVSLAPALNHPIGVKAAAFMIVAIFLVGLGLTMTVGHLRERGRRRRAHADIQSSHRDAPPPTR